jgi:hypothetical protein
MEMWNSRAVYLELLAAAVSKLRMHSIFGKGHVGTFQVEQKTAVPVP